MAKVLTNMYKDNYRNRCFMVSKIIDYFRYDFIRIGVLGILTTLPDDLLKVINSKMYEWLGYDDIGKLNMIFKFINERVIK